MYQSDLSDEEWGLVTHHFEHKVLVGKKPIYSKCAIVNAALYISKAVPNGACCPRIIYRGKPFTTIISAGTSEGMGSYTGQD
ncbi:hypothetical protein [Nitrosomonas sp. Is37]|uniref:hypothetical protein n=1 Tax=Nitrosomonas sp. Is37 TaxID=3080535 RepID=UPI00294AB455|nr:hypothetical protein [Nitrosomonas sp. Is37]MDV6345522.1 hypothetical protein [Nitrosomonas sp. Is37]